MLKPIYLKSFERENARDKKRRKDLSKMRKVMDALLNGQPLPPKNKNHKLKGEFDDYWEFHVEPHWLLVYKKKQILISFSLELAPTPICFNSN